MQFCGTRRYPRQTPEVWRRWTEHMCKRSRQPARRGPANEPERRSKGGSLEAWRSGQGPTGLARLGRESAADTGSGLRVNNRMQATAGPLVVRARAVRRRA